jgi:hypothetical protein
MLTVLPLMVRLMDRGEALLLQFLLDLTKNYAKQKKNCMLKPQHLNATDKSKQFAEKCIDGVRLL